MNTRLNSQSAEPQKWLNSRSAPTPDSSPDGPISRWWPIEEFCIHASEPNHIAPTNPFWLRPYDGPISAGVCNRAEILFFPHVYLGVVVKWDDWLMNPDGTLNSVVSDSIKHSIRAKLQYEQEPVVQFDEQSQAYKVYIEPSPGDKRIDGAGWDWGEGYMPNVARWLMIYPDPDAKRLVPALFTRGELWFTQIEPLTARLISEFGYSGRWEVLSHDGSPTLLQRLRDLTGYGVGDFKIMDTWRDTARRFHMNPIFRSHPVEAENIRYRQHLERWIQDGRVALYGGYQPS